MLTIAADGCAESVHQTILHLQENMTSGTSAISHILVVYIQRF